MFLVIWLVLTVLLLLQNKETTDPRSRVTNNTTHRGGRGGAERYGRGGSSQFISNGMNMLQCDLDYILVFI